MLADQAFADPQSHHPVAVFGQAAQRLEQFTYADHKAAGVLHVAGALLPLAGAGLLVEAVGRRRGCFGALTTAAVTWACLGTRRLADEGALLAERLTAGDLAGAREQLPNLCGRDPSGLPESELARATIESMAENTSDAGVATLFWGAIAGVPGMLVHRGANTLDAMVGHRNARYQNFGWAAARLDDALALLPARLTAGLAALTARSPSAWRVALRDHAKHPSPNGGWCEAAWAGALGVQLGGTNVYYSNRVEQRGLLGDGPRPRAADVRPAAELVTKVTYAATGVAIASLLGLAMGRRR